MKPQHQNLASGKWQQLSFSQQMANIGSEVERSIIWQNKNNLSYSRQAGQRFLELLFLTIADPKNKKRLKELTRLREVLLDYFFGQNQYASSDRLWQNYFYPFTYFSRINT
ncbi:hypothetical protein KJ909_03115 [Patescibacteria group bacterium]|nr:hypothetical protein [Patescibacteria group bacterium]